VDRHGPVNTPAGLPKAVVDHLCAGTHHLAIVCMCVCARTEKLMQGCVMDIFMPLRMVHGQDKPTRVCVTRFSPVVAFFNKLLQ
jgi:hypothetical protein